jgi:hypothetical protein
MTQWYYARRGTRIGVNLLLGLAYYVWFIGAKGEKRAVHAPVCGTRVIIVS